jgi:hypothetical protein
MTHRLAAAGLLVSAIVASTAAAGFRCDGHLVSNGDHRYEVRAACGEPDLRLSTHGYWIGPPIAHPVEEIWYYNFGPNRFIRELHFRSSRLDSIRSRGYGFHPGAPGTCRPQDLRRGMTVVELHARCGEPDDRELRLFRSRHGPSAYGPVTIQEEWFYDFGPNHFYRIVTIIDGHITFVERGSRGR